MPANIDMSLIDAVIQVGDKDAMVTTRKLAKQEALFVGGSCGAAVYGALEYVKEHPLKEEDLMVIILPDSGSRYVEKIFNDEWIDRKSTRLNSSHVAISYAVFC